MMAATTAILEYTRTTTGEQIDAYSGGPVEWDRPPGLAVTFKAAGSSSLSSTSPPPVMRASPTVRGRWNSNHETALRNVTVYYVIDSV